MFWLQFFFLCPLWINFFQVYAWVLIFLICWLSLNLCLLLSGGQSICRSWLCCVWTSVACKTFLLNICVSNVKLLWWWLSHVLVSLAILQIQRLKSALGKACFTSRETWYLPYCKGLYKTLPHNPIKFCLQFHDSDTVFFLYFFIIFLGKFHAARYFCISHIISDFFFNAGDNLESKTFN